MKTPSMHTTQLRRAQFMRGALLLLLLILLSAAIKADGPSSKLINYNGKIGQNESHYDVRVEFWRNNENPHPGQDCHNLNAGRTCIYNSYGFGMRVYNNHAHAIRLDLKESLIFSQFPPTTCESQISWVDERGPQKQYRIAPGGFIIDPNTYLGLGAISSMLGSSPSCFFQDRPWEAVGYNINLYWKEIIPQPPKQPAPSQPAPSQPVPSQPVPSQPVPSPPPPPMPDPAVTQKQWDELDRISQRMQEIAMRAATDGSNYGDAAYCRDVTGLLGLFRDIANQTGNATIGEAMRPLLTMYQQIQTQACDRSTWTSSDRTDTAPDCVDTWDYLSDNPSGSEWCSKIDPVMDNIAEPAPGPRPGNSGSRTQGAKLKAPCVHGVAGCND